MKMKKYDIVIIGSGPAGLSAAIYCIRGNMKTLVIGIPNKSRAYLAHKIENYFGIKSISGKELIEKGIEQVKSLGGKIIEEEVIEIKPGFILKTAEGNEFSAKAIILANGVSNKVSGIINEKEYVGKGISYCVECDGAFFTDKKVGVVGNGNYAAKKALDLLNYTKDVTIFTGEKHEISETFIKKLKENNIKIEKKQIKKVIGEPFLSEIEFEDGSKMNMDGLFIALGIASSTDFARSLGIEMESEFIKVDEKNETSIKGIFAAGDCTGGILQISKAVGEGANAALNAMAYVKGGNVTPQWG